MLRQKIYQDFIAARKAKDQIKSTALSTIFSAIKNAEIDAKQELGDEAVVKVLQKELKQRKEAIDLAQKAGRQDTIQTETFEKELIQSYLPQMMSEAEIVALIDTVMVKLGSEANFGQIMQQVMAESKGKADGQLVSQLVRQKTAK